MDCLITSAAHGLHLDSETWCIAYASNLKWPDGFFCPGCGTHHQFEGGRRKLVCRYCGRYGSLTSGTLLHGSKKRLSHLLQTLWWASGEKSSLTIRKLQHHTGLTSYQTAWFWMKKLRLVMGRVLKKCRGIVLSGSCPVENRDKSEVLLVAMESTARGRSTGQLRMGYCPLLDGNQIERFWSEVVEPGSVILVPAVEPFISVRLQDMLITTETSPSGHDAVIDICAAYRSWLVCEKQRCSRISSPQDLLEEFCFMHNSRLYSNRLLLFEDLVTQALSCQYESGQLSIDLQNATRGGSCL